MKRRHPNISEETAAMQRQEAMGTRPQDRYADRLKFTGCPECRSDFGMQAIYREALAGMLYSIQYVRWHQEAGNDEYLFCVCGACNRDGVIPGGFTEMTADEVRAWLDRGPMASDDVLGREELVIASE